jgi:hypothetical protein
MAGKSVERDTNRAARATVEPLSPGAEARFTRRLGVLLGLVPLTQMTQEETDWVFEQKMRIGGDD